MLALQHAEQVDHADHGARGEGAAREAEAEDAIARPPALHQEAVRLADVLVDAAARGQPGDAVGAPLDQVDSPVGGAASGVPTPGS